MPCRTLGRTSGWFVAARPALISFAGSDCRPAGPPTTLPSNEDLGLGLGACEPRAALAPEGLGAFLTSLPLLLLSLSCESSEPPTPKEEGRTFAEAGLEPYEVAYLLAAVSFSFGEFMAILDFAPLLLPTDAGLGSSDSSDDPHILRSSVGQVTFQAVTIKDT